MLSETHITEKIKECETELGLYDQYITMSNSPKTGGVTLYFKKQWKLNKIKENVKDSKHWIAAYMVKGHIIYHHL